MPVCPGVGPVDPFFFLLSGAPGLGRSEVLNENYSEALDKYEVRNWD